MSLSRRRRRVPDPPPKSMQVALSDALWHCLSSIGTTGIEPSDDFGATADSPCDCENCQQCRAAYALHLECFKGHLMASFDADLQRVVEAWDRLPEAVRKAVMVLTHRANATDLG